MKKAIQDWVDHLTADDFALLYFAGHGVPKNGELYLPMTNFSFDAFEETAISFEWIREVLDKAPAKGKLILIDACFSGTSKENGATKSLGAAAIAKSFAEAQGAATLASSQADQESWLWAATEHSLFTFWLIEGFSGEADENGDRKITIDELFEYVRDNVDKVSSNSEKSGIEPSMKRQTPDLTNGDRIEDVFELPVATFSLKTAAERIAARIDVDARMNGVKSILIPEFATGPEGSNVILPNYGSLPKYVANEIRMRLAEKSGQAYYVISETATREILEDAGVSPSDLGGRKTTQLKDLDGEPIDAIVSGRLNLDHPVLMYARVALVAARKLTAQTPNGKFVVRSGSSLGQYARRVHMDANALAQRGASFVMPQTQMETRDGRFEERDGFYVPTAAVVETETINAAADQTHPLVAAQKDRDFDVAIIVRKAGSDDPYVERKGFVKGKDFYVPLEKGEEYAIQLTNKNKGDVFVKVLVDGLNSLSQLRSTWETGNKGLYVEAREGRQEYAFAPRVSLEEAAPWILYGTKNENNKSGDPVVGAVYGFYTIDAKQGEDKLRRFQITDADESLAARTNYTEQLGLITVGVYEAIPKNARGGKGGKNEIGTSVGEPEDVKVERDNSGQKCGDLKAVYTIRYVTPEKFEEIKR